MSKFPPAMPVSAHAGKKRLAAARREAEAARLRAEATDLDAEAEPPGPSRRRSS